MSEAASLETGPAAPLSQAAAGWRGLLHGALLFGFLAYVFIGTQPFGDASAAQRVDGSPLDRIAVFGLFALALVALAARWRDALDMVPRNLGLAFVTLFCLASVAWSDHPDLTVRRAVLLVMLTVVAAGVAVGVTDLRRFHTALFLSLVGVVLLNIVATIASPGVAITDLGVRGIYTQKNVAGIVAMISAVVALTWTLGASNRRAAALGVLGLVPILAFLLVSRSKTSIALTALAAALILGVALVERLGPKAVAAVVGLATLGGAGALAAFASVGFDPLRLVGLLTGDATFTGRVELWSFALDNALQRPWLGHGYGAFWDVGPGADPLLRVDPGSWLGEVETGTINQAHNGYLELWLHIGLPATIVATLVVAARGVGALHHVFGRETSRSDRCAIAMLAMIIALYLLHNLTEATLFMRGLSFCNMAALAMLLLSRSRSLSQLRMDWKGA